MYTTLSKVVFLFSFSLRVPRCFKHTPILVGKLDCSQTTPHHPAHGWWADIFHDHPLNTGQASAQIFKRTPVLVVRSLPDGRRRHRKRHRWTLQQPCRRHHRAIPSDWTDRIAASSAPSPAKRYTHTYAQTPEGKDEICIRNVYHTQTSQHAMLLWGLFERAMLTLRM